MKVKRCRTLEAGKASQLCGFTNYSADPVKDAKWKADTKRKYSQEDWDREFELMPVGTMASYPVFGEWRKALHEQTNVLFNPSLGTVYRGWDFGYVHPYVVLIQLDGKRINTFGEIYGENVKLEPFAERVLMDCAAKCPGVKFIEWVDPAGNSVKDDGRASVKVLKDLSLDVRFNRQEIEDGIRVIGKQLTTLDGDRPCLVVNPAYCKKLLEAVRGGYRRDKHGKPIKDGTFDHPVDAWRYVVVGVTKHGDGSRWEKWKSAAMRYHYRPRNRWTGY